MLLTTNKEDDVVLAGKKIIEHEVDSIPVVEINARGYKSD